MQVRLGYQKVKWWLWLASSTCLLLAATAADQEECPWPPPSYPHYTINTTTGARGVGATIIYTCKSPGHYGSQKVHCLSQEPPKWEVPSFHCLDLSSDKAETCGPPPNVTHATPILSPVNHIAMFGQQVRYTCISGYRMTGGTSNALCQRDEQGRLAWQPPSIICSVLCPLPPVVAHASPLLPSPPLLMANTSVAYECAPGFLPHPSEGPLESRCLVEGTRTSWSPPSFSCFAPTDLPMAESQRGAPPANSCLGPLPHVENGQPLEPEKSHWAKGSVVLYGCKSGFQAAGGSDRAVCLSPPLWQPPTLSCQGACPPQPPAVMNANPMLGPKASSHHFNNSAILYTCLTGYRPSSGSTKAVCRVTLAAAYWILPTFSCSPVDCGFPGPPIQHGKLLGTMFTFTSIVEFGCEDGYLLEGESRLHCLASGNWSAKPPSCSPVPCAPLPPLENGVVDGPDRPGYRDVMRYSCVEGYRLQGAQELSCLVNGTWSGAPPHCNKITCPLVKNVPGQSDPPITISTNYQGLMILRCAHRGDTTSLRCSETGEWEPPPVCKEPHTTTTTKRPAVIPTSHPLKVVCQPPPKASISNGKMEVQPDKQTLKFSCQPGYQLRGGPPLLQCSANGTWPSKLPFCAKPFPVVLVIGVLVGGVVLVACVVAAAVFWHRRRRRLAQRKADALDARTWEETCRLQELNKFKPTPTTVL